jgi:hypothetical protein
VFLAKDAPPTLLTDAEANPARVVLRRDTHEPVFVRTQQAEFNYPAGSDNVQNRYEGRGGIPISSFGMKLAAALNYADRNMLLTGVLTPESRMMINRNVRERVSKLADFLHWDGDPYLVLTDEGRLVWMIDGYTASERHPYSRKLRMGNMGVFNYIRNSVKATVDAYDGHVNMYVFDESDPLIRSWRAIFPALFKSGNEMPETPGARSISRRRSSKCRPRSTGRSTCRIPRRSTTAKTLGHREERVLAGAGDAGGAADVRRRDAARADEARVPVAAVVHSPKQGQPDRRHGCPLRSGELRRGSGAAAFEAEPDLWASADRGADRFGPEHFERSFVVEPAGLAGAPRADAGLADRQHVHVRRADLYSVAAGSHAAVEEGGPGGRQPADL